MSYAIIGAGHVGRALAKAFARKGIEVAIASRRSPEALTPVAQSIGPTIIPQSLPDALQADVILLAMPFRTYPEVAKAAKSWQGKLVIDVTNAYGVSPEELGNRPSSAVIAEALPGASLVKAFNHLPAAVLSEDPNTESGRRRKRRRYGSGLGYPTRLRPHQPRQAYRRWPARASTG
jgi:predicted dinucleotide-binding enzyme